MLYYSAIISALTDTPTSFSAAPPPNTNQLSQRPSPYNAASQAQQLYNQSHQSIQLPPRAVPFTPQVMHNKQPSNTPYQPPQQQLHQPVPQQLYTQSQQSNNTDTIHDKQRFYRPPHPVMCFGIGGTLFASFPQQSKSLQYNGSSTQPGRITSYSVQRLVHSNDKQIQSATTFPGPLLSLKASDKSLLHAYIRDCIDGVYNDYSRNPTIHQLTYTQLLWKCLAELVHCGVISRTNNTDTQSIQNNKNEFEHAVIKLLLDNTSSQHNQSTPGLLTGSSLLTQDQSANNTPQQQDTILNSIQELLLRGDTNAACHTALQHKLWSHALLLAGQDRLLHEQVVAQFATNTFVDGSPVQTIYLTLAKQHQLLFTHCPVLPDNNTYPIQSQLYDINTAPPIISNWRANLAAILANPSLDDTSVITRLGDILQHAYGLIDAAHICYLIGGVAIDLLPLPNARMTLITANHRSHTIKQYTTAQAIHATEIYEYVRTQHDSTYSLPQFQIYKFIYACMLIDIGDCARALQYI